MKNLRRNAALIAAAAVVGSLGIGGVMAAQADTNTHAPANTSVVQSGSNGAEEKADGPDQGRDANPNEPGHQDADESGEAEGAAETADGPDQGPDANPNEPGHQDADESGESEGAAETADGPDRGVDANPNLPGHQDLNETGEAN